MNVTILDTRTGEKYPSRFNGLSGASGSHAAAWGWGNNSCDCNRAQTMEWDNNGRDEGVCAGCSRFLVVEFQLDARDIEDGYGDVTLFDLNSDYPPELLAVHGISK